jgi:hypothetical protein
MEPAMVSGPLPDANLLAKQTGMTVSIART